METLGIQKMLVGLQEYISSMSYELHRAIKLQSHLHKVLWGLNRGELQPEDAIRHITEHLTAWIKSGEADTK
jgi:hypothetical protein